MHKSIKPLIALVMTAVSSWLVFSFKTTDPTIATTAQVPTGTTAPSATTAPRSTNSATTTQRSTATATPAPTTDTATASAAQYADGTFTGAAIREPWGTFEVEAIIKGGELTDVQLVSEPRDRHSNQINAIAVPLLTETAIATQSAAVDVVSGATWTSESYAESLQAALDAAAAAAVTSSQVAS